MADRRISQEDRDAPSIIGDADNVEKTTWVTGHGTDPRARHTGNVEARTPTGGGANPIAWIAIALVVLIALVYAFGVFT